MICTVLLFCFVPACTCNNVWGHRDTWVECWAQDQMPHRDTLLSLLRSTAMILQDESPNRYSVYDCDKRETRAERAKKDQSRLVSDFEASFQDLAPLLCTGTCCCRTAQLGYAGGLCRCANRGYLILGDAAYGRLVVVLFNMKTENLPRCGPPVVVVWMFCMLHARVQGAPCAIYLAVCSLSWVMLLVLVCHCAL